jgi:hypothetical protein
VQLQPPEVLHALQQQKVTRPLTGIPVITTVLLMLVVDGVM